MKKIIIKGFLCGAGVSLAPAAVVFADGGNYGMMGRVFYGGGMMGYGLQWVTMFLVWVLLILGIIALWQHINKK